MISAMFNGLSGLDAFQKALNTQSNNIANVNTVAYKSDDISFSDMMYQDRVGKGTGVMSVEKNFSQGEIKVTGKPYDVSLKGDGFFVVDDNLSDEQLFTRSGNLRMNSEGFLQTPDNRNVLGKTIAPLNANNVVATDPNFTMFSPLFTNAISSTVVNTPTATTTFNARTTDFNASSKTDDPAQKGNGYKTAGVKVSDIEKLSSAYRSALDGYSKNPLAPDVAPTSEAREYSFDLGELDAENDFLEVFVDNMYIKQQFEQSKEQTMNSFADQISAISGLTASANTNLATVPASATLSISGLIPGKTHNISDAKLNDDFATVVSSQNAVQGSGLANVTATRDALKAAVENADAKFLEISNQVDYIQGDQLPNDLDKLQLKLNDLGLSSDPYGDIEFDPNGMVYINQDGSKFAVGKLSTVRFTDNLGLIPKGNNVFGKSDASGEPSMASSASTQVVSNSLEMSNADLAVGLTDLMIYQRAYEANAKSLTTSDEFLNVAIQLKK